ncbi:MAG: hypothetical protein RLZZ293_1249 [Pseudomonadota bacterium]|jgi:2',3'-cyclic-nucleotide 2'-phosphodiesterase/3'-nucleotidase
MKKLSLLCLTCFISYSYATDDITIVSLNDFHGQVQANKTMVGAGKISSFLQEYKKTHPNLIIVSAGDNYQGTAISNLSQGQVVNDVFKLMGVRYSAIGNHEFDYGQGAFESWYKAKKLPFLAANIRYESSNRLFKYAHPFSEVKLANGKKVAFIGLSTLETPTSTASYNVKGLKFTDPAKEAQLWIKYLNSPFNLYGKPNTVVLLTHIPTEQDASGKISYDINPQLHDSEINYVTSKTKGISAVISGHSHMQVAGTLNNVAVVQANSQGKSLGVLHFDCHSSANQCVATPEVINLAEATQNLVSDPKVESIINYYYQQNQAVLNQKIGYATEELPNMPVQGIYNIKLTYMAADYMRQFAHTDIGLQNTYGIRRDLPKGDITYGMLYEVMPFDNTIFTLNIKGSELIKLIEHSMPSNDDNSSTKKVQLGIFAGVGIKVNSSGTITQILINGTPLDLNRDYSVATIGFLATGGDGFDFSKATNVHDTNLPIRDLIKQEWLQSGIKIPNDWQSVQITQ